jgi:hypothetical protein
LLAVAESRAFSSLSPPVRLGVIKTYTNRQDVELNGHDLTTTKNYSVLESSAPGASLLPSRSEKLGVHVTPDQVILLLRCIWMTEMMPTNACSQ